MLTLQSMIVHDIVAFEMDRGSTGHEKMYASGHENGTTELQTRRALQFQLQARGRQTVCHQRTNC